MSLKMLVMSKQDFFKPGGGKVASRAKEKLSNLSKAFFSYREKD